MLLSIYKKRWAPSVFLSLAFLFAYLLLSRPEVIFISQLGFTAWYPATGLVFAVLLGASPWYVIAAFLADTLAGAWIYHQPLLSFGETIGAAGVTLSYATAAYVLRSRMHIDVGLRRRHDIFRYVFVSIAAALVSTLFGVGCLLADHSIVSSQLWASARGWFFGDAIGLLGVAPFLLVHVLPWVRKKWPSVVSIESQDPSFISEELNVKRVSYWAEVVAQAASIWVALWVIFSSPDGPLYLTFVPIVWIAMRQGIRRLVSGLLVLNFGIVVAIHVFPPSMSLIGKIGLLMLVVSAVGLITGSEVSERHRTDLELQQRTLYLDSIIENSPLAIAVLDRQHRVELVNSAFEKLFLYDRRELVGNNLELLLWPDQLSGTLPVSVLVEAGHILHENVHRRRKDGQTLDLELHAVPLVVRGSMRGAYTIYKDISEQMEAAATERRQAESLKQLVGELELRSTQMTLLNEMGSLLYCSVTSEEACAVVSRFARQLFPTATAGTLYLFRSSRNSVEASAQWGLTPSSESLFEPDSCWALRRGQTHWSHDGDTGTKCAHLERESVGKSLCVPMVGHGDTVGILHLQFRDLIDADSELNAITEPETERVAVAAARQIALSIANLRLRKTLRDQSVRDPLTGLFNRRFMEESLEREILRAARKHNPVSVLFVDLDHFKKFNDSFGHDAGDLVLRSIADVFRDFFRADDVVCRFGGEEFAIILPESSIEHTAVRANALREEVKKLKLRWNSVSLGTISASMGIASFPQNGSTPPELLRVADQCLYKSKNSGRDMVTSPP